jgi:hypothetical protein
VTSTERLLDLADALDEAKVPFLVMGGHAVRYYGLERNTADFDFHLSLAAADALPERLARTRLFQSAMLREETTWRGGDFRRFQIGTLPNGREEWMEFWFRNHLLGPFDELVARQETGRVLRRNVSFLSLPDLMHSKETERNEDWRDVAYLEEVLDQRLLRAVVNAASRVHALQQLRSRRGFETALLHRHLAETSAVDAAVRLAAHPVTLAWLLPYASTQARSTSADRLEPEMVSALGRVTPASPRHLALVEAARLAYQRAAQAKDREDKARFRAP